MTALKSICKANGVFLLSSDKETLVRDAHLFYWGFTEINQISNYMDDEKNYKKSFRLKLNYEQLDPETNCFDDFYLALTTYRNTIASQEGITFDSYNVIDVAGEKILTGEVTYQRRKPGKVELLRDVTQRFSFTARKADAGHLNIDFIFNDRGDVHKLV